MFTVYRLYNNFTGSVREILNRILHRSQLILQLYLLRLQGENSFLKNTEHFQLYRE